MQAPHKLWPAQELRAIRDCLRAVLAAKANGGKADAHADTFDVSVLIGQIAECESLFLKKSVAVRRSVEVTEKEIAQQKQIVEQLEARAKWEAHRKETAVQQAEIAARIADDYINESGTNRINLQQSDSQEASSLNAKIQHIVDQSVFNERFKSESVNSLTRPLAQLDVALEE